jgi:hypothetical protein
MGLACACLQAPGAVCERALDLPSRSNIVSRSTRLCRHAPRSHYAREKTATRVDME